MKKHMRKILLATGVLVIVAVGIFMGSKKENVKAATIEDILPAEIYSEWQGRTSVWRDSEKNFVYQIHGKKKSSNTSTHYRTIGIEFSRIREGINPNDEPYISDMASQTDSDPHYYIDATETYDMRYKIKNGKTRETIIFDFEEQRVNKKAKEVDIIIGGEVHQLTTVVLAEADVRAKLNPASNGGKHSGWYAELIEAETYGHPFFFGVDHVIIVRENPVLNAEEVYDWQESGKILQSLVDYMFTNEVYTWANWDCGSPSLSTCRPWNANTIYNGAKTEYNKYTCYNDMGEVEEETPPDDGGLEEVGKIVITKNSDASTTSGASGDAFAQPDIYTYNIDNDLDGSGNPIFHLGEGIPTTENYRNGISVDSWYGHVTMTEYQYKYTQPFDYLIDYTFTRTVTTTEMNDETGEYEEVEREEEYTEYRRGTVNRDIKRNFISVSDVNLFQTIGSSTYNNASGIPLSYNRIGVETSHVPYLMTVNGLTVRSGSAADGSLDQVYGGDFITDKDSHIDMSKYSTLDTSTITYSASDRNDYNNHGIGWINRTIDARLEAAPDCIVAKNDVLMLNNRTYLDEDNLYDKNGNVMACTGTYEIGSEATAGGDQKDTITSSQIAGIPEEKENGIYYTSVSSTYRNFIKGNRRITMTIDDAVNRTKTAILSGYEQYEPIVVHSPVIAPITIEGADRTQLKEQQLVTQMLLDSEYTISFNWERYFAMQGYDLAHLAGWKNYVQEKYIQFPFAVKVNGTYYEPEDRNGYTQEIAVGKDTEEVTVYIPSWAVEGVYGLDGYAGYDAINRPIRVRCTANNYNNAYVDAFGMEFNASLQQYQAKFNYPVQISGILYDFQILATNDELQFASVDEDVNGVYNFVSHTLSSGYAIAEKRIGSYNRLGGNVVQYTVDGTTTSAWPKVNTLPFASGKSNQYKDNGYMKLGTTFSFSVKTIASLAGENSYVNITPSYRYVSRDGTVYESDEISIYYNDGRDNLIKMGSVADTEHTKSITLADLRDASYFKDCFYDYYYDTIAETAATDGVTEQYVLIKDSKSYNVGNIRLGSDLRLITANEEELAENMSKDVNSALRYQSNLGTLTDAAYERFKDSMQTWYGQYTIPGSIMVCRSNVDIKASGEDVGITGDELFWLKDGYLILSFDIETKRDGDNNHLVYFGGNGGRGINMWGQEAVGDDTADDAMSNEYGKDHKDTVVFNDIRDGDVAIIPLDASIDSNYNTGILYLN